MNRFICSELYDFEFRKNLLKWMDKIQDVFQEGRRFYHFHRDQLKNGEEVNSVTIERTYGRIKNPICHRGLEYFRNVHFAGFKLKIKNILTEKIQKCRLPARYCYSNGSWPRYEHYEYKFGFD